MNLIIIMIDQVDNDYDYDDCAHYYDNDNGADDNQSVAIGASPQSI